MLLADPGIENTRFLEQLGIVPTPDLEDIVQDSVVYPRHSRSENTGAALCVTVGHTHILFNIAYRCCSTLLVIMPTLYPVEKLGPDLIEEQNGTLTDGVHGANGHIAQAMSCKRYQLVSSKVSHHVKDCYPRKRIQKSLMIIHEVILMLSSIDLFHQKANCFLQITFNPNHVNSFNLRQTMGA